MKRKLNTLLISLPILAFFNFSITYSQSLISSAGNSNNKGDISISWSLGELAIQTLEGGKIYLTQGLHQIDIITSKIQEIDPDVQLNVYPNPAKDLINILARDPDGLSYQFINTLGVIIHDKNITTEITQIPLNHLTSGFYYLNVYKDSQLVLTHKISIIK